MFAPARKAHPAFRVSELRRLARTLQAAGYQVILDDERPGIERFYAWDPFGNRLEFMTLEGGDWVGQD
jgi:hypothetical protein